MNSEGTDRLWRPIPGMAAGTGKWVGTDASSRFPIYTRGNAGEVYPEVFRPLTFSISHNASERAMRRAILTSGLIRPAEIEDIPMTTGLGSGVFGGYSYLNLSLQRLGSARLPGGSAEDADVSFLGVGEPPRHIPLPRERNRVASLAGLWYFLRLSGKTEWPQLDLDAEDQARFLASLPDPTSASDRELRQGVGDDLIARFGGWFETHLVVSFGAGAMMAQLTSLCERHLGDDSIAMRLVSGLGEVDSAAPALGMWRLAKRAAASPSLTAAYDAGIVDLWERIQAAADEGDEDAAIHSAGFRAFITEFGSRGPNEWDTAFDTWETDPSLAFALIDRMRFTDQSHAPDAQHDRLLVERETLESEVVQKLGRPIRSIFRQVLRSARLHIQWRERAKTNIVRAIHGARLAAQELDRRMVERSGGERGDLWFLLNEELDAYIADPATMLSTIGERRTVHAELARRIPPFYFSGELPSISEWELRDGELEPLAAGETLTGLPGCTGTARGRARIVTDLAGPLDLEPGDVLVAPSTDPSWTPLFVPADAVVVDVGAAISHAVIVSRELGIPCAISVQNATRRLTDGALIEVDGTKGTVTVIETPA